MISKILFLVLSVCLCATSFGQENDSLAITKTINQFFLAMKQGNSLAMDSLFYPNATLQTSLIDESGNLKIESIDANEFVTAIGKPHKEDWNEVIDNLTIKVDSPLASVWMEYSFFLGETYSHCGVNSFTLVKDGITWYVLSIIDTRHSTCQN